MLQTVLMQLALTVFYASVNAPLACKSAIDCLVTKHDGAAMFARRQGQQPRTVQPGGNNRDIMTAVLFLHRQKHVASGFQSHPRSGPLVRSASDSELSRALWTQCASCVSVLPCSDVH